MSLKHFFRSYFGLLALVSALALSSCERENVGPRGSHPSSQSQHSGGHCGSGPTNPPGTTGSTATTPPRVGP